MSDIGGRPTSQRAQRGGPPPPAEALALTPTPTPSVGAVPVGPIRARVRDRLGEALARHGFRPANGAEDAWARPCCDGTLQLVEVRWLLQISSAGAIATLGLGYHVTEAEALSAAVLRPMSPESRYSEATRTLHVRLDALLPRGARREWVFPGFAPGTAPPGEPRSGSGGDDPELEDLCEVAVACTLPFLVRHRSGEEVFAELERQYESARAPDFATHLRFACREVVFGRVARAIARVERALAALDPHDVSALAEAQRSAGTDALARFRSWGR